MPAVPFKANAKCRHHIPKQKRRLTNWPAYEASLRQRGDLTVWFSGEAIAAWRAEPRTNRGGQPWYSPLAILTALTLRTTAQAYQAATAGRSPCGSVSARARKYSWLNEGRDFSGGFQHSQNRCGAAKEVEPAVVGGDLLIGSGAGTEKVA